MSELSGREVLAILEEEIQRLPRQYRMAVVLCCLEGLTVEEAAKRLDTTAGAIRGRLERGRSRLFECLKSRGLLPATVLAVAVTAQAAYGSTAGLRLLAVRGACDFASNAGGVAGVVPVASKIIAEGVLNAMLMTKLKVAGYGFLALVLAAGPAIAGGLALGLKNSGSVEVAAVTPQPSLKLDYSASTEGRTAKTDDKGDKADHRGGGKEGRNRGTDKDGNTKHDGTVDKDGNAKVDDDHKDGDTDKDGNPKRSRGTDKDGNSKDGHGDKRDGGRDKGPKSGHS